MTRDELLRVVRACYAAFAARDIAGLRSLSTPDCIYEAPGVPEFMPWAGRHEGHAGLAQFIAALDKHLAFLHFEATDFIVDDVIDDVVVLGRAECRSKTTGRSYVNHWAHRFRLRQHQIVHFREFPDTAAQLIAVLPVDPRSGGSA